MKDNLGILAEISLAWKESTKVCEFSNAYLGKMFHRIMIHSKNYISALVGRKCAIFGLKIEPY